MNTSGGPISKLAAAHKVAPEEILVIHDEMDLEPGTVRVKVGGGHGGHNGLKSIHAKLGSDTYTRVRVGTGHPPGRKSSGLKQGDDLTGRHIIFTSLVEYVDGAVALAADAALCAIDDGATMAMNRFN